MHHGRLPLEKVQKIFTQLVGAVAYVHNRSCVHRDLKLENILLDKNENVKLCDFGFTREYEGKASYLQTFCGTICYAAPEMLKGDKYAGEKVDVWSLGIILFALLTGELPFDDDDDMVTKHKIVNTEPNYPDMLAPEAKALVSSLLSKRPLLRPSLADILTNPFLAENAPQQQAYLKLTQPPPFSTPIEKDSLERMRCAGVDIDKVIEHVLAQRCDALAGWWALLIEKEERKEKRRERKRRERDAEMKLVRRLSVASSRLDIIAAPSIKEVDEGQLSPALSDSSRARGRRSRRNTPTPHITVNDQLPRLPEGSALQSPASPTPPPPIDKDSIRARSVSSSRRRRPIPPPKEIQRKSRASTLQLVIAANTNPDLLVPPSTHAVNGVKGRKAGKQRHAFMNQLASLKHWFVESAKRAKSPSTKSETSTLKVPRRAGKGSPTDSRRSPTINSNPSRPATSIAPPTVPIQKPIPMPQQPPAQKISKTVTTPRSRVSLSPAPITPRSASYRRSSAHGGLRGRKSTSSSISSIRSIKQIPSHSKASSTSSTSTSVHSSAIRPGSSSTVHHRMASPHNSVKVLPATPTFGGFPSNIRVVRAPSEKANGQEGLRGYQHFNNESFRNNRNESFNPPISAFAPSSPLIFAKRRKTPFRGPALTLGASAFSPAFGGRAKGLGTDGARSEGSRDSSAGRKGSPNGNMGGDSGEIIEEEGEYEEEEDGDIMEKEEEDEEEVEEVDNFSPVNAGIGERVVEVVYEEGEV